MTVRMQPRPELSPGQARSLAAGLGTDVDIAAVTKRYGNVAALESVGLSIRAGEFLTLLGPSGSGKSTLLMLLSGFEQPDSGSITINGRAMNKVPANRRDQGIVFQKYALFPHMTVRENVAYPLQLRGVAAKEIALRVENTLERVRMPGFGARFPHELSGGQQQRVALARAIVHAPPLLLMDESLSALDRNLRAQMQLELIDLHRELGTTIIYVTHDQGEALTMSDRVAVLREGRLVQLSTPHQLYHSPENRFVAQFTGDANLLSCRLRSASSTQAAVVTDAGRTVLIPTTRQWPVDAELTIVARPEVLRLQRACDGSVEPGDENDGLQFAGSIERIVFFGSYHRYEIRTQTGLLIATRSGIGRDDPLVEGDAVTVTIDPRDVWLVGE